MSREFWLHLPDEGTNSRDELCIPPLFSGTFSNSGRKDRPVYPYGSVFEDEAYRDNFK